jgi:hypothetical protein
MKKIVIAFAVALSAGTTALNAADPVLIASTADGATQFYGHPESFEKHDTSYSMEVTMVDAPAARPGTRVRAQIAVTVYDCARGTGTLYTRENSSSPWDRPGQVSISSPKTVADRLAATLCEVGKTLTEAGVDL